MKSTLLKMMTNEVTIDFNVVYVSIYYIVNIYCRPSVYYRLIIGLLGFRPNLLVLHILSIYRQLHVLNITLNIIYTELILLISVSAFSLSSLRFSPSSLCILSLFSLFTLPLLILNMVSEPLSCGLH